MKAYLYYLVSAILTTNSLTAVCPSTDGNGVKSNTSPRTGTIQRAGAPSPAPGSKGTSNSYWLANITRQGRAPFGEPRYRVYRNVRDFGAKGDGKTDDTAAINFAVATGNRCGKGCDSSTTKPALVYFPPGTYLISSPIVQYYFTQFVGDALTLPTLKATSNFKGMAVIDADPYNDDGSNWYTNQNNFFRQIRNFVIDLTAMPPSVGAGIHWQVAQATSLTNIVFNMVKGGGENNKQSGIFMDNGSGGFMSDLVFNGGGNAAFFGSQQFTTRNLTFNDCQTAIYMNWNWLWALKSININNCRVGIDMANSPEKQTVGSVLLQDSRIRGTPVGIRTAFGPSSNPNTAGTLIIDNVDFAGCPVAVQSNRGNTILRGGATIKTWAQGREYQGNKGSRIQKTIQSPNKPSSLLDRNGRFFERSRPQYEHYPPSRFVSVKSLGAKGDGRTDDTAAIQKAMGRVGRGQILYFDHGAYVISSTVKVPANIKMTGEVWPMIMAKGEVFQDQSSLTPMFEIGNPGELGAVEMSDLVFQTAGAQPGATLVKWNLGASSQGSSGMWDVHFRIGGSAGTGLQSDTCRKTPQVKTAANPACAGAGLLLHITKTASVYMENQWVWVADHELDLPDHGQINIYNGRGVLVESSAPTWFYGHASEHSVLYNYNLHKASNVYMSSIQTETAYFQSNPDASTPFTTQSSIGDPTFGVCAANDPACKKTWGVLVQKSQDVLLYGAGLYSFFDNYDQECLKTESCQKNMVNVIDSQNISLYGLSTKAATNMISVNSRSAALDKDNRNGFCATIAAWTE